MLLELTPGHWMAIRTASVLPCNVIMAGLDGLLHITET